MHPSPRGAPCDGLADDPETDPVDQARVLEDRNEAVGRDQSVRGMPPAQQGLGADEFTALGVELRLVVNRELVVVDGPAQLRLEAEALPGLVVELLPVEGITVPPPLLDMIHGQIGLAQQFVMVRIVVGENGDPDTRRHMDRKVAKLERGGEFVDDPLRNRCRPLSVPGRMDDDGKLVATEPGDDVVLPEHAMDPLGEGLDQGIAGGMTEGVVDGLETIDVEEHDRVAPPPIPALLESLEVSPEHGPVVQTGQLITIGQVLETP